MSPKALFAVNPYTETNSASTKHSGIPKRSAGILPYGRKYGDSISTGRYNRPYREVNNIRYPMAGMTSHRHDRYLQSDYRQNALFKDRRPHDRYFTNISWSPDGKSLYLIELNRDQNHAKLCLIWCRNRRTGRYPPRRDIQICRTWQPIVFFTLGFY